MSGVRCQCFFCFFLQSGGASRWSICYQWGLHRLFVFVFSVFLWGEGGGCIFTLFCQPLDSHWYGMETSYLMMNMMMKINMMSKVMIMMTTRMNDNDDCGQGNLILRG